MRGAPRAAFVWGAGALWMVAACGTLQASDDTTDGEAPVPKAPAPAASAPADANSGAASGYRDAVIRDGALAYFRFDEKTGPMVRSDIDSLTGSIYGDPHLAVPGAIVGDPSTAIDFYPTNGAIDLGDHFAFPATSSFSVELWMRLAAVDATYRHAIMRGDSSYPRNGYTLYVQQSRGLGFERSVDDVKHAALTGLPPFGDWHHVVGTYDGASLVLYLDGVSRQSVAATEPLQTSAPVFALGDRTIHGATFSGALDEIAIYDKPLSPEIVLAHFNVGRGKR